MKKNKIDLVMREEELNGPMRFAADNMATQEECEELIKLANVRVFTLILQFSFSFVTTRVWKKSVNEKL